jgi:hypothetical protein
MSIDISVLVRWLGGSFEKLDLSRALCGFANVPPNALTKNYWNIV